MLATGGRLGALGSVGGWTRVATHRLPQATASTQRAVCKHSKAQRTDSNALNLCGLTLKQTIATYRSGESLGMTSLASWEVPMPEIPTAVPPAPTSERSGRRVRNMDSDDGKENQLGCRPDLELTLSSASNL